jgi:hypothetical protein
LHRRLARYGPSCSCSSAAPRCRQSWAASPSAARAISTASS